MGSEGVCDGKVGSDGGALLIILVTGARFSSWTLKGFP